MSAFISITALLAFLLISVVAIPLKPTVDGISLVEARSSLRNALERLGKTQEKLETALKLKAEYDLRYIKQELEKSVTGQRELALQTCVDETCEHEFMPIILNFTNANDHACACIESRDYGIATAIKLSHDRGFHIGDIKMPEMILRRAGPDFDPLSKATNFTYIPPPSTDITPQLIDQSLASQPQHMATVASVMPYFPAGYVQVGVQLDSFVASLIMLNMSTDLPCGTIGQAQRSELQIRPKDVYNASEQPVIPDCSLVAVNMYKPTVINYWVQNRAGAVFSLVGSNKLVDIDKLNSTESVALILRAIPTGSEQFAGHTKRNAANEREIVERALSERGFSAPDMHTATMSAEACAGIKCNNNGGQSALFNPFTKSCACKDPVYVEIDHA